MTTSTEIGELAVRRSIEINAPLEGFEGGWDLAPLTALRNIVQSGRAK
jgi:hypothetical protein